MMYKTATDEHQPTNSNLHSLWEQPTILIISAEQVSKQGVQHRDAAPEQYQK